MHSKNLQIVNNWVEWSVCDSELMFCPLSSLFSFTRNSIRIPSSHQEIHSWLQLILQTSTSHFSWPTTAAESEPPWPLGWAFAGVFLSIASPLPPLPAHSLLLVICLNITHVILLLCSNESTVFFHLFQVKSWFFDLPCSDCKHFILPPSLLFLTASLAVPQTLQSTVRTLALAVLPV